MITRPILDKPHFIDRDANAITSEIIALYEQLGNKKLYPAQADRLFIDVIAYREMLIRTQIQLACEQNLLAFASGVMLDYLGDFFGVVRLSLTMVGTRGRCWLNSRQRLMTATH